MTECRVSGCYSQARAARGLCFAHYERLLRDRKRALGLSPDEPMREWHVTEKRSCVCADSKPQVLAWFSRRVLKTEPKPGSIVECGSCGLPIEAYLDAARQ
jgi:hypothetical protein